MAMFSGPGLILNNSTLASASIQQTSLQAVEAAVLPRNPYHLDESKASALSTASSVSTVSERALCFSVCRCGVAIRSITENLCSGERWLYRADMVIVLWPASSWISLIDAPAMANQEQNVCRFECQT